MESQLDSVAYLRESYEECYAGCLELVIAHDRRTMPDSRAIFAYSANKGWKPITDYDTPLPRQFISINSPEFAEHAENAIIELLSILNTVLSEEGLTWGNFCYPSPDLAIRDSVMQAYYPLKNYNAQYHQALAMGTSCFAVKTNSISNDIQPTPVDQLINPHKQWLIANLSADFYEEEADDGLDVESSFN